MTQTETPTVTASFDTVIVAHTTRETWTHQLVAALNPVHVAIDNGRLGCTKNHLTAWKYHAEHTQSEWALVIEDDAVPIPEFPDQAAAALAAASTPIVSLYLGKQRPPQHQPAIAAAVKAATRDNHAYITADRLFHAVAVAIRTDHLAAMLRIAASAHRSSLDIDEAITEWAQYDSHLIAYTLPSLVDHRDQGTIARHRDMAPRQPGRTAYTTGTRDTWDTDTTEIAWH